MGGPLGMFGLPAAGNLGMQADGGAAFGGAAQSIGGLPTSLPMSAGATLPMSAGAALPIGTVSLPLAVGGSVPAEGLGDLGLGAKQEDGDGAGGDDGSGR